MSSPNTTDRGDVQRRLQRAAGRAGAATRWAPELRERARQDYHALAAEDYLLGLLEDPGLRAEHAERLARLLTEGAR